MCSVELSMKKLYNLGAWSSHNEAPIQYNIEKFECFISLSSDYFFFQMTFFQNSFIYILEIGVRLKHFCF